MDPARHPQALDRLITGFTERVPTVLQALVVSSDGVPVAASEQIQPDQVEKLAAITSGLISLAEGAARIFDGGAVTQALVAMSLAVLTTSTADLDLIAYEMTMLAQQAGTIFTPPARGAARDPGSPA